MKPLDTTIPAPGHRLHERILRAATEEELDALIGMGKHFDNPSDRTRARWRHAAKRRRRELLE